MAGAVDPASYKEVLLVLGTAAVVVPAFHRLKVSPIFGFMMMGALLGPDGLARLVGHLPFLDYVTISERENFAHVAELGVVFLLFMIGLELSFERLRTMRRLVFGMGAAKVAVCTAAIAAVILAFGRSPREALIVGACLALSSTALVVQVLAEQKRLGTATGRSSFAILLFEDIAVVPLLVLVSVLGASSGGSVIDSLSLVALKAGVAVAAIILTGRYLLRPVFRRVAATRSPELFMAACLLVIFGTSLITAVSGLSMALGAFLAGLILAETEYRRQIEVTIEPFKGLLLGVFFFAVGMSLDVAKIMAQPLAVLGGVLALLLVKGAASYPVMRAFRVGRSPAIEGAALMAPAGEFAFVVIGLAVALGVIGADIGGFAVTVATLSLVILPVVGAMGRRFAKSVEPARILPAEALVEPHAAVKARVIIAGFGRVGQLVASMLEENKVSYLAVDTDAVSVAEGRRAGKPVYFGDASRPEFLERCGLAGASAVVVTMDHRASVEAVSTTVRTMRADIVLVARARDRAHARQLYERGVTEAVPEAFEASLHLAEATLISAGVPLGLAIASVHERRDQFRAEFQRIDRGETRTNVARIRARRLILGTLPDRDTDKSKNT
jgi:CPA2 family monovalent cation:H+ antiporter-2